MAEHRAQGIEPCARSRSCSQGEIEWFRATPPVEMAVLGAGGQSRSERRSVQRVGHRRALRNPRRRNRRSLFARKLQTPWAA